MTDIVGCIAAVMQEHSPLNCFRECSCGTWRAWTPDGESDGCHEEHVASVLVEQLGLTEERATLSETNNWPPIKTGHVKPPKEFPCYRLVSGWRRETDA